MSCEQDGQGAEESVSRLEKLVAAHPDVPEIAIRLAKELRNLSCKQDKRGTEKSVSCLEKLAFEYHDVPEISMVYAKVLFNLSNKQDYRRAYIAWKS